MRDERGAVERAATRIAIAITVVGACLVLATPAEPAQVAAPSAADLRIEAVALATAEDATLTRRVGELQAEIAAEQARIAAEEAARQAAAAAAAAAAAQAQREAAAAEASRAAQRWTRPLPGGYRVSAGFGRSGGQWSSGSHTGQDLTARSGSTVVAVAAGQVVFAGSKGRYGNRVEIRHADGTVTSYSHLSAIKVRSGAVQAGQPIGAVGQTGNAFGPHLHFEAEVGGQLVNPVAYLSKRGVRL
jgi:murein DD-endopeptidase MepM/ murein hydrolase activator NlpD